VLLDLLGARYHLVEVRYGQRDELARLTARYVYVPVLLDDDGKGVVESRDICAYLLARAGGRLVPSPWEGGKETRRLRLASESSSPIHAQDSTGSASRTARVLRFPQGPHQVQRDARK
jgi:glutathione S-transferase